jgi:hypothetical protein
MATEKNQVPSKDEFIGYVRPDSKSTDKISLISGYVGDSSEENHIRMYFDEELNNFIEVNCDDIVHTKKRPEKLYPLGGSFIWVKSTSVFTYGNPTVHNRPKSSFLEGELMRNYQNIYGYTPNPDGPYRTTTITEPITTTNLPTFVTCPHTLTKPSRLILCPSDLCPSYQNYCPINSYVGCPTFVNQAELEKVVTIKSAVDACPSALGCTIDQTIYQTVNQVRYAQPIAQNVAAFNPSWVDGCRSAMVYCPPATGGTILTAKSIVCPSRFDGCPSTPGPCTGTIATGGTTIIVARTAYCPSAVDACPSAPGGCIDDLVYKTTYVQNYGNLAKTINTNVFQGAFNPLR